MTWITKPRRELDSAAVRERYGITARQLDKFVERPTSDFPRPRIDERSRRRLWVAEDLDRYDARRSCEKLPGTGTRA